jgi:hypothetical protein
MGDKLGHQLVKVPEIILDVASDRRGGFGTGDEVIARCTGWGGPAGSRRSARPHAVLGGAIYWPAGGGCAGRTPEPLLADSDDDNGVPDGHAHAPAS